MMRELGCSKQQAMTFNDNDLRPTSFFSEHQIRSSQILYKLRSPKSELSGDGP